ncbi:sodium-coupled neutral amino acid transporter 1 isoform X2 [Selaginella moellendorffii]|uniref:sodium-coupled neutral amino acid transporter 1 isoform X2 n=1 Tax=Selaginella moellendorffii TaxID=88036 RepID=UPI000D1CD273|nr:sodium-coupled neutral amino acid transporter 1 isoform X2 [Selaginella moellendorffii]|eukprot:XP_024515096.1 sodium-coupled neutral amino acid transporter 1 isoform X2 [Selaginella moellendorffii]
MEAAREDGSRELPQRHVEGEIPNSSSPPFLYLLRRREYRHALFSGIVTLTLSIMGGAVLPVSNAFTTTGIVCGFLIMLVVALANTYTCDLLLRQAYCTGALNYESLAFHIGGKWWKLATEISIVVLLIGTIIGNIQQVSEAAVIGIENITSNAPSWLTGSGRVLMILSVVFIVAPICLVEKMRQLEFFATVGTSIVIWLLVVIVIDAIRFKLPAVKNGELAAVGFTSIGSITQAISTFGFAFYVQPMMMPFLAEMPAGKVGVKLTSYSVRVVILGTSFFIYGTIGFFGAARYGSLTSENILENKWLGGGVPQGSLNLAMAGMSLGSFDNLLIGCRSLTVYLAFAIPTVEFPTRYTINRWIPGDKKQNRFLRHLCISAGILVFCTGISLISPNNSGAIITITGATGVSMVSYTIPVVNHFLLFFQRAKCQKQADGIGSVLKYRKDTWYSTVQEYAKELVLPAFVIVVGIFCSIAALTTL